MYYFDKRLQWPVKVEKPDPLFARQLHQAIGGVEGEFSVMQNTPMGEEPVLGPARTDSYAQKEQM